MSLVCYIVRRGKWLFVVVSCSGPTQVGKCMVTITTYSYRAFDHNWASTFFFLIPLLLYNMGQAIRLSTSFIFILGNKLKNWVYTLEQPGKVECKDHTAGLYVPVHGEAWGRGLYVDWPCWRSCCVPVSVMATALQPLNNSVKSHCINNKM